MRRVNRTLSDATYSNTDQIGEVQEHGHKLGEVLIGLIKRANEAESKIKSVRNKIDVQVADLNVRKEEIKLLARNGVLI